MSVKVTPDYASISSVRDICEPWISQWGGDEWGESMANLHGACHTDYCFSDEDCALFASKLIENLEVMKLWVDTEGQGYGFDEPVDIEAAQQQCREARDYWLKGGNIQSEHCIAKAKETIDTMPGWLFGE